MGFRTVYGQIIKIIKIIKKGSSILHVPVIMIIKSRPHGPTARRPLAEPIAVRLRYHSNGPLRLRNLPLVACTTSCRRVVLLSGGGNKNKNNINNNIIDNKTIIIKIIII